PVIPVLYQHFVYHRDGLTTETG
ncbi:hypothetical protein L198_05652, partial [Cryptococcus wingfieldii CBS 7118]